MLKGWTRFQKWTVAILSISLMITIGIIVTLLIVLQVMERRLEAVGNVMEEMAIQHIITEVTVDEKIPLKSDISVMDELVVNIDMTVNTEIPFTAKIPVSESMLVPFKIGVKDYIKLDTTIQVTDWVNIDVNDTIPLDQKVKMPIFGDRGPSVPIQGKIPVKQTLNVGFSELLPVHSVVPVEMLIIDTLPVGLDMKIPVNVMVPVSMPIRQQAKITFNGAMPVDAQIPITLTIPVDIPLETTSLAVYFRKLAAGLKGLTNLSLEDVDLDAVK